MKHRIFFSALLFKTRCNLRIEVARYYLNYIWWVVDPLITMIVFYVVFGIFLNRGTSHFVAFLLIGTVMWNWFAKIVLHASNSVYQARGIIQQIDIPKVFFPIEVFLRDSFKHLIALTMLIAFLLFHPSLITWTWVALPLLMLIQAIFSLGIAILCAAIVPFIPDLQFIVSTGLQLMFFGSGIFYSIEDVLPDHQYILYINPMAGLLKAYRDILIYARWPEWIYLAKVSIFSVAVLFISIWLIRKLNHTYPRICQQ